MTKFSSLNIKTQRIQFTGDKIKINKILNIEIEVLQFKIEKSKIKEGTDLLTLQIIKKNEKHIVFTGSKVLIEQIKQVPQAAFPFTTTIYPALVRQRPTKPLQSLNAVFFIC